MCPYYLARELKSQADVIFMPYNYILDIKVNSCLLPISLVVIIMYTLMSHLLMGAKFSDFATSVPWFRGSAKSCHISFHSVKY